MMACPTNFSLSVGSVTSDKPKVCRTWTLIDPKLYFCVAVTGSDFKQ